jgi:cardiolipin synthase
MFWSRWLLASLACAVVACSGAAAPPAADGGDPIPLEDGGSSPEDAGAPPPDGGTPVDGGSNAADGGPGDGGTQAACTPYVPRDPAPRALIGYRGLENELLTLVNGARTELLVFMYELNRSSFVSAFIAAKERGVNVRILLDPKPEVNASARQQLVQAGVSLRDTPSRFTYSHSKVLVVDREVAVVMSANLNGYSFTTERNYAAVDRDPQDIADLVALFEADWTGASPDLSCTRLIVSPVNSRSRLTELINGATRSLDLAVMYISDSNVRNAIKARAQAGVPVRVLLADPCWIDGNVATAGDLLPSGVSVKYLLSLELHAKLVVADGVAFVGSENFSFTSLDRNREVGVLITETAPRTAIAQQFEADWSAGVTTTPSCR